MMNVNNILNQSEHVLWYFNFTREFGGFNDTDDLPLGSSVMIGCTLGMIVLGAILGNILVVSSVCTNKRLRTITNFYVVSLALADLFVATFVMPLAIVVEITGRWLFGSIICEMWVTCDVMLCTASILNLCCISLDRYFAITRPLVYSTRRSKHLALAMIAVVWVAAIVITCPPIFGWQEEGRYEDDTSCHLTKDPGYIIYSSLGSFYLPLLVMIFAYMRIFRVASQREKRLKPYRRSFRRPNSRNRTKQGGFHDGLESIRLTEARDSEDTEERSPESHLLRKENGGLDSRSGQCVSVRRLQEGLVIHSALTAQQETRIHRDSLRGHTSHYNTANNTRHSPSYRSFQSHSPSNTTSHHSHLHRDHHNSRQQHHDSPNSTPNSSSKDYLSKKDERRKEQAAILREHKAAKTLAVVVGGFILCWLPFFLIYIIEPFCTWCNIEPIIFSFFTWLGYFNSVLNPFIYALYNKDFRYSFWKLTLGRCFKSNQPTHL